MKLLATLLVLGITKHLQLKYDSSFEKKNRLRQRFQSERERGQ